MRGFEFAFLVRVFFPISLYKNQKILEKIAVQIMKNFVSCTGAICKLFSSAQKLFLR